MLDEKIEIYSGIEKSWLSRFVLSAVLYNLFIQVTISSNCKKIAYYKARCRSI